MTNYDVIVVGCGNAGMSAALAAHQAGGKVLVLERAPVEQRGGNSMYTGGAFKFPYESVDDILAAVPDISQEQLDQTDFGSYTREDFLGDIARLTEYRTDPDLAEILVTESMDAVLWHRQNGVSFLPKYHKDAFKIDGTYTFWGGDPVEVSGGGRGLIERLVKTCENTGIEIAYESRARELIIDANGVVGLRIEKGHKHGRERYDIACNAVILAAGGFEANAEWRTRYLGPGWELAKVRGTRHNTGDGIQMALDVGAVSNGHWSGCHAVQVDVNSPNYGDYRIGGNTFERHSYQFGIMVNNEGKRFVDEGADFRNFTYANYGARVIQQPGQVAWQVFDAKMQEYLRDEYAGRATKVTGNSIEELASKMEGIEEGAFVHTVREYNDAVANPNDFNPNVLDGVHTSGLTVNKSNWARLFDTGPYVAYPVTCGITFSYGGLKINTDTEVIHEDGHRISGLYAAGELVGGLHYFNYAGGSGLSAGTVFGRRAGANAVTHSRSRG